MRDKKSENSKKSLDLEKNIRSNAIKILEIYEKKSKSMRQILRGHFLSSNQSHSYRSAVESLCLGVTRYLNTIDFLISRGLKSGTKKNLKVSDLAHLRLAIYEIHWLEQPIELIQTYCSPKLTLIAEKATTIDLCNLIKDKPVVNRYSLEYSHPTFFIDTIINNSTYENTLKLLQANNSGYPAYVRPNTLLDGNYDFHELLVQIGAEVKPDSDYPDLFQVLKEVHKIVLSKYFAKGQILIQEKGSITIINALNPKPGDIIWDACAAPGQKTHLICEFMNQEGRVVATDIYPNRLQTGKERTTKMGCKIINWVLADAVKFVVKNVDKILIDVPCSSTGILYSHPSFKWRLNKETLFAFMSVQNKILDGILSKYQKCPDTEFVYASCSVLPHEGESQIDSIMQRYEIELLDVPGPGSRGYPGFRCSSKVRRLFPHLHQCGGFFIARFKLTC